MSERPAGMIEKFRVERLTPSSRGIDHADCRYFVIDPQHDLHAAAALLAYATSCDSDEPQLAAHLRAWAAPEPRSTPGPSTGTPEPSQAASEAQVERACEVMHDAYEAAAAGNGWETQAASRKPWADVPEANKATMRAAIGALLDHLAASEADSGEVAQLREALERLLMLADHDEACPIGYDDGCDPDVCANGHARDVLASVDAPAPDEAGRGFRQAVAEVLPMLVRVDGRCQACSEPVSEDDWPSHAADAVAELLPLAAVSPVPAPDESR